MDSDPVADPDEQHASELRFLTPPGGHYLVSDSPNPVLQKLEPQRFSASISRVPIPMTLLERDAVFTALGRHVGLPELARMSQSALNIKEVKHEQDGIVYQIHITTTQNGDIFRYSLGLLEDGGKWGLKSKARYLDSESTGSTFITFKGVCIRPVAVPARLRATSFVNPSMIFHKSFSSTTAPASRPQNDPKRLGKTANAVFANSMDTDGLKQRKRKPEELETDDEVIVVGRASPANRARRSRRTVARVGSYAKT